MFRKIFLAVSIMFFVAAAISAQGTSTSTSTTATAATADKPKKPAVFRPTKDQIKQVQTMLKDKKLYEGEASGSYNEPTRTGIKSFQKDNALKETGTLNRATLEKFGVELTANQKLSPVSPGSFANADDAKTSKPAKTTAASTPAKATTAASSTDDKPKKAAPFRATPDQIKAAQKMLKDGKMYAGEETGKLDDPTRDGLRKFQEGNGVKITGTLHATTLDKMGISLTDKQKADAAAAAPKK